MFRLALKANATNDTAYYLTRKSNNIFLHANNKKIRVASLNEKLDFTNYQCYFIPTSLIPNPYEHDPTKNISLYRAPTTTHKKYQPVFSSCFTATWQEANKECKHSENTHTMHFDITQLKKPKDQSVYIYYLNGKYHYILQIDRHNRFLGSLTSTNKKGTYQLSPSSTLHLLASVKNTSSSGDQPKICISSPSRLKQRKSSTEDEKHSFNINNLTLIFNIIKHYYQQTFFSTPKMDLVFTPETAPNTYSQIIQLPHFSRERTSNLTCNHIIRSGFTASGLPFQLILECPDIIDAADTLKKIVDRKLLPHIADCASDLQRSHPKIFKTIIRNLVCSIFQETTVSYPDCRYGIATMIHVKRNKQYYVTGFNTCNFTPFIQPNPHVSEQKSQKITSIRSPQGNKRTIAFNKPPEQLKQIINNLSFFCEVVNSGAKTGFVLSNQNINTLIHSYCNAENLNSPSLENYISDQLDKAFERQCQAHLLNPNESLCKNEYVITTTILPNPQHQERIKQLVTQHGFSYHIKNKHQGLFSNHTNSQAYVAKQRLADETCHIM